MYLLTTFTCSHLASCAHEQHEQKPHGQQWVWPIGAANINALLRRSWAVPKDSKHTEATFLSISTDLLCLRVAQMPRCPDLAIFVVTTDDRQQTKPIAFFLVHARGVKINLRHRLAHWRYNQNEKITVNYQVSGA